MYYLHEVRKEEAKTREDTIIAKHKEYERITTQLDNLVLKYTSPENQDGKIISDEEYIPLRSKLLKIKSDLAEELKHQDKKIEEWVELTERTFNFARYARMNFTEGSLELKKSIFACLGSDLLLEDQKVRFILRKPFNFIFEGREKAEYDLSRLEPVKNGLNAKLLENFALQFPVLRDYTNRLGLILSETPNGCQPPAKKRGWLCKIRSGATGRRVKGRNARRSLAIRGRLDSNHLSLC